MEHRTSWETNCSMANYKISHLVQNLVVYYPIHKSLTLIWSKHTSPTVTCKYNKKTKTSLHFTVTWLWPIEVKTCHKLSHHLLLKLLNLDIIIIVYNKVLLCR